MGLIAFAASTIATDVADVKLITLPGLVSGASIAGLAFAIPARGYVRVSARHWMKG